MIVNYSRSTDIICIVVFQLVVLSMYYLGPIEFLGVERSYRVMYFILFYLFCLVLGYGLASKFFLKGKSGPKNDLNYLKISYWVVFIFLFFDFIYKIDILNFRLDSIGNLYKRSADLVEKSDSIYEYIKMFFGYYIFGLFPLFILNYSNLTTRMRFSGGGLILLTILLYILSGTNKILFNYLMIFFIIYIMSFRHSFKNYIYMFMVVVFCIFIFYFFSLGQLTREGSAAVSGYNPNTGSYSRYSIEDGVILVGVSSLIGYLIQGYRAFELSFYVEWNWTYGFGNSSFLSRQFDRIFTTNISDLTIPAKIEIYGWDRYNYWSSFYSWWISDLGYYGIALLMFIMGFVFRIVKNTAHYNNDTASKIIYFYFIVMFFYLSANNQIFQSGEGFFGFLILIIPYFFFRKIYIYKSN